MSAIDETLLARVDGRRSWAVVLLLGLVIAVFASLAPSAPGAAQESDAAQSIQGRVQDRFLDEDGKAVLVPVPDVRIIVEDEAGAIVGEAVTDADGAYRIPLVDPGTFVVRLDVETLPEDLTAEDGKDSLVAEVRGNQNVTRVFFLGEDTRNVQSKWSLLPQTLANGLKLAMIIAITSIGLSLIFGTTGLSNFAHGEMVTFGAFAAFVFNSDVGWHLIPAAIAAVVLTGSDRGWVRTRALATAAPAVHESHLDDDRLDRCRARDALLLPVPVRWKFEYVQPVHAAT